MGGGYALKEKHQADERGNFSFHIDDNSDDMVLRAFTDQGYQTIWQEAAMLQGGHNNKKLVLKAQAPAWLRIELVDQLPKETVHINFDGGLPSTGLTISGRDTVLVFPVLGNTSVLAYWEIDSYGPRSTIGRKDVYCPGLDTTTLRINF